MGPGQLKRSQFKVFHARLRPHQTVSAFKQELTRVTALETVPEQAAAVTVSPQRSWREFTAEGKNKELQGQR